MALVKSGKPGATCTECNNPITSGEYIFKTGNMSTHFCCKKKPKSNKE